MHVPSGGPIIDRWGPVGSRRSALNIEPVAVATVRWTVPAESDFRGRSPDDISARRADARLPGLRANVRVFHRGAGVLRGAGFPPTGQMPGLPGQASRRAARRSHQVARVARHRLARGFWQLRGRSQPRLQPHQAEFSHKRRTLRLPGDLLRLRPRHRSPLPTAPRPPRLLPGLFRVPAGAVISHPRIAWHSSAEWVPSHATQSGALRVVAPSR
ncbi:MAG: hypothetical protein QOJ59_3450 [Thermomicrobiales bacterium]|nr:hypothetical protein [Thermomicrobiales bacterium]